MTSEIPLREGQFTLTRVFLVMAGIGVFLALARMGVNGFLAGVGFVCVLLFLGGWRTSNGWAIVLGLGGALWALMMWASQEDPHHWRRHSNVNSAKQIMLALHSYYSQYGVFPPAYVANAQGRPMHSWRVLLLPYLEQEKLYAKYKFDEPWDGPNNRKLHNEIVPQYFTVRIGQPDSTTEAGFLAITGTGTAWPGSRAMAMDRLRDGTSNTIMVVEVRDSGVHWMEPRDLHVAQMNLQINPRYGQGPSSHSPGGAIVGVGDGSVRVFPNDRFTEDQLRAMITADGGEPSLVPYYD